MNWAIVDAITNWCEPNHLQHQNLLLETPQRLPLYWRAYRSSRSSNGSRSKQQQQFGGCNYEDQASLWRSREAPVSSKTAECGRRRQRCTAAGKTAWAAPQRRRTTMATSVHRPIAWRPHLQPFFNQSTKTNEVFFLLLFPSVGR